jgi:hypothetical protein
MRILIFLLVLSGCSSQRLLRLENQLLKTQNKELRGQLDSCESQGPPKDYVNDITPSLLQEYLFRAGFQGSEQVGDLISVPVKGENTSFRVTLQHFEREKVLYIATHDYLRMEDAASSQAMVLLLTQLAALNYELLIGKFQLNPKNGAIALSVELNIDDGLGFKTFEAVVAHLAQTADARYPQLVRAASGQGF